MRKVQKFHGTNMYGSAAHPQQLVPAVLLGTLASFIVLTCPGMRHASSGGGVVLRLPTRPRQGRRGKSRAVPQISMGPEAGSTATSSLWLGVKNIFFSVKISQKINHSFHTTLPGPWL